VHTFMFWRKMHMLVSKDSSMNGCVVRLKTALLFHQDKQKTSTGRTFSQSGVGRNAVVQKNVKCTITML